MTKLVNTLVPSDLRISSEELSQLKSFLDNARKIAVLTHISADSDAYGSAVALTLLLRYNYQIDVKFITEDSLDSDWLQLIGNRSKRREIIRFTDSVFNALVEFEPSHVITVDINHFHRLTTRKTEIDSLRKFFDFETKAIAVIDHHVDAKADYGDVIILKPYTSTAELLYVLLELFDWEYDKKIMNLLLLGILGDLGRLKWLKYPFSLEIIQRLLVAGADWYHIYTLLGLPINQDTLHILSLLLSKIRYRKHFSYLVINYEEYKKFRSYAFSRIKSFLKEQILSQVRKPAYLLANEKEKGKFYISIFSNAKKLNLHHFAERFGGGGHSFAAAFPIKIDSESLEEIFSQFDEFLEEQLNA